MRDGSNPRFYRRSNNATFYRVNEQLRILVNTGKCYALSHASVFHWAFDKTEGIALGRSVADYVFDHTFTPIRPRQRKSQIENAMAVRVLRLSLWRKRLILRPRKVFGGFFYQFPEARIAPEWIEHRIEPEQRSSEWHAWRQGSLGRYRQQRL